MRSLRGLRGLLGITIAWSIAWIPLGIFVGIIDSLVRGQGLVFPPFDRNAPIYATVGAVRGFGFGLVLAAMERRRSVAGLTFSEW